MSLVLYRQKTDRESYRSVEDEYEFEVDYHPFELNPEMPNEGRVQKEYLVNKFGGEERYRQITNHVTEVASQEGLQFDFSKQKISPNTLDSHRLIAYAKREGKQHQMKEALMSAYFEKGTDLTQTKNLIEVASQLGMNADAAELFLQSDELKAEIKRKNSLIISAAFQECLFILSIINPEFLAHSQQKFLSKP